MSTFKIGVLVIGHLRTNCYILQNEETKEAIVIDPADDAGRIIKYLQENDLVCQGILLTHGHFDHIMAVTELAHSTGVKVYSSEKEVKLLADPDLNMSASFYRECRVTPDILLKDHELLSLIGFQCEVLYTPGHTEGGVCYYFAEQGILFSGDTLFYGSMGRSDFPTGNGRLLVESIREKLLPLPEDTIVYPGHGEATTIGYERENNVKI